MKSLKLVSRCIIKLDVFERANEDIFELESLLNHIEDIPYAFLTTGIRCSLFCRGVWW